MIGIAARAALQYAIEELCHIAGVGRSQPGRAVSDDGLELGD